MIKQYLKEPLFHFLVLGGLIFYTYSFINGGFGDEDKKIKLTQAEINQLTNIWQRKYFRKPTDDEKQKLINKAIYTEIMYREALNLGLDKDDPIIRRRLVQKLEFLSDNFINKEEPTVNELEQFMQEHKKEFLEPAKISFYFKDSNMLQKKYENLNEYSVSKVFGREFTDKIFRLKIGVWHKNIKTVYGNKTLFIELKIDEKLPQFKEVESKVREAYLVDKEVSLKKEFYENLKSKYTIDLGK